MKLIYAVFILLLALMTSAQCQKTAEDFFYEGNALCMQDKYDEAIKCYDEVIRLDPRNTAALNNKGNALNALRRNDEEDAAIAKAEELSVTAEDWSNKGVDLCAQDKYYDAIKACDDAIWLITVLPLPGATKAMLSMTKVSTPMPFRHATELSS